MTLARGRVVRGDAAASAATVAPVPGSAPAIARGRRLPAPEVDARVAAARIVEEARARARALVTDAEASAAEARARAEREGREAGEAKLAAAWLRLRAAEARRDDDALDRTVALARLLAERLVGEALALDPTRVRSLARELCASIRRARRVAIEAHPDDADVLAADLGSLALDGSAVEIQADPARARGSLRVRTDIGTLDGDLAPQLERLLAALRDELRPGR